MASPSHASFLQDTSDPLTRQYLAQDCHETPEQRIHRETVDIEAMKRSKEIDQWLRAEMFAQQKVTRKQMRIILVGQSESGKSTTVKNFQLQYAPRSFWAERGIWKTVIHLNLVRSIRRIHNALSSLPLSELTTQDVSTCSPMAGSKLALRLDKPDENDELSDNEFKPQSRPTLSSKHELLLLRLRPILDLDAALMHQLMHSNPDRSTGKPGPCATDLYVPLPSMVSPFSTNHGDSLFKRPGDEPLIYASLWSNRLLSTLQTRLKDPSSDLKGAQGLTSSERPQRHFTVNQGAESLVPALLETTDTTRPPALASVSRKPSSSSIGSQLSRRSTRSLHLSLRKPSSSLSPTNGSERSGSPTTPNKGSFGAVDRLASTTDRIMAACASDIADMWKDPIIRKTLDDLFGIRVESEAGFFLDDVERVTALNYKPTDDDILKARLKTLGVSEYRFVMDSQLNKTIGNINEMIIYDVGGSRTQRHRWINYFEDVDSLIFLAPLSAYDQRLVEDPTVNRVQDTLDLWKSICSSPLLKKVEFILFLNKCDLLKSKLRKRIPFRKYITSYDGPETFEDVIRFFKSIFTATWGHANEALGLSSTHGGRSLHIHWTNMVDSRETKKVVIDVRDTVARSYLRRIAVL